MARRPGHCCILSFLDILDANRTEASRNASDAGTVADLDLQHDAFPGTQMTAMISHADTLIGCGASRLEVNVEDGQVIVSGAQPATREEQR